MSINLVLTNSNNVFLTLIRITHCTRHRMTRQQKIKILQDVGPCIETRVFFRRFPRSAENTCWEKLALFD